MTGGVVAGPEPGAVGCPGSAQGKDSRQDCVVQLDHLILPFVKTSESIFSETYCLLVIPFA
jgi:hypothetical protein